MPSSGDLIVIVPIVPYILSHVSWPLFDNCTNVGNNMDHFRTLCVVFLQFIVFLILYFCYIRVFDLILMKWSSKVSVNVVDV